MGPEFEAREVHAGRVVNAGLEAKLVDKPNIEISRKSSGGYGAWILDFSLVSQMDGLLYALLGVRIERDAFATDSRSSLCRFYGCESFMAWSAYTMIFVPRFDNAIISSMLDKAAAQNAVGVFVLPVWTEQPWYARLLDTKTCIRRLVFKLPRECFKMVGSEAPIVLGYGVMAYVLDFGFIGRLKTRSRPEREFQLKLVPELYTDEGKVPTVPFLLARDSHLAKDLDPTMEDDVLHDAGVFREEDDSAIPEQRPSRWNLPVVRKFAGGYPHGHVAQLALQVADKGVNPFVGNLHKSVVHSRSQQLSPEAAAKCREEMMEESKLGRMDGPLAKIP